MVETKARKCSGKRRHSTKTQALSHMWALIRKGASESSLNVYACEHCEGGWHVGHRPGRRKK